MTSCLYRKKERTLSTGAISSLSFYTHRYIALCMTSVRDSSDLTSQIEYMLFVTWFVRRPTMDVISCARLAFLVHRRVSTVRCHAAAAATQRSTYTHSQMTDRHLVFKIS